MADEHFVAKTLILTSELEALRRRAMTTDQQGFGQKEFGTEDSDFVPVSVEEFLGKDGKRQENEVNPVNQPIAAGISLPKISDDDPRKESVQPVLQDNSKTANDEGPEIEGNRQYYTEVHGCPEITISAYF